jgi:hypothetical protein
LIPFIHFTICNFASFRLCLFTNSSSCKGIIFGND